MASLLASKGRRTMPTPAKLSVNFSGVEIKKGGDYVPPNDYLTRVISANVKPNKDGSGEHLVWGLQVVEPAAYKGKKLNYRTTLKQEGLWKLRSFLVDILGEDKVPAKAVDIPLAKIVAAKPSVGISTEDGEYKGRKTTEISGTFSKADWAALSAKAEEASDDTDDDEEVATETTKATGAASDDAEGEDMDELELDDL